MQDLQTTLSSPVFWVTTVVFGLLINLVSAYVKSPLDKLFGGLSEAWRKRSTAANHKFLKEAWELAHSEEAMRAMFEAEVRNRLRTTLSVLLILVLSLLWWVLPKDDAITGPISSVVRGMGITWMIVVVLMHPTSVRYAALLEQAHLMRPDVLHNIENEADQPVGSQT